MDLKQFKLNCRPSPPDERDYQLTYLTPLQISFPEEFYLPYNHQIKNQGSIGSCVAHACTYAREMVEENQNGEYKQFSPGFIYGMRESDDYQGEGMFPREALDELLKLGICDYSLFPYNDTYPNVKSLLDKQRDTLIQNALPHRITAYVRLNSVEEIKTALMQLGPVLIGIPVYESFYRVSSDGLVPIPQSGEKFYGGHSMVIVGWKKDKWIVLNSWSQGWGDNGKCYLPFDFPIWEKWSITDKFYPEIGGDNVTAKYNRTIKAIVVHHPGDGLSPYVSITQRWNPKGYDFPSYDFGVEADGSIVTGRPLNYLGAHCRADKVTFDNDEYWFNKNAIGVAVAGDFTKYSMPKSQYDGLIYLVKKLMNQYNVPIDMVYAHKDLAYTECPGNWSFDEFKKLLVEDETMEDAILIYGKDDFTQAHRLADTLGNCAIFLRKSDGTYHLDVMKAKRLFVLGGSSVGHQNEVLLSGPNWFASVAALGSYLGY